MVVLFRLGVEVGISVVEVGSSLVEVGICIVVNAGIGEATFIYYLV